VKSGVIGTIFGHDPDVALDVFVQPVGGVEQSRTEIATEPRRHFARKIKITVKLKLIWLMENVGTII